MNAETTEILDLTIPTQVTKLGGVGRLNRRTFVRGVVGFGASVTGLVLLSGCDLLGARPSMPRIGWLGSTREPYTAAFVAGLHDYGYTPGQNIVVEWRFFDDRSGVEWADLAAELVALKVQVIVTSTTPAVVAAAQTTQSIPIVSGGPSRGLVDLKLAASDARPGGNLTGTGSTQAVYAKYVELLKDIVPGLSRVGYLRNPTVPGTAEQMAQASASARALGIEFLELPVLTPDDINAAFDTATSAHVEALIVSIDNLFAVPSNYRVVDLAAQYRLPAMYSQTTNFIERGGLMAYSPDFVASQRRAAAYVDKILKGANPGSLPLEQAMTFELKVNLKTAHALGVTFPPDFAAQVTEWVQ
jgi:putative ABC transport system substrate-binding protein